MVNDYKDSALLMSRCEYGPGDMEYRDNGDFLCRLVWGCQDDNVEKNMSKKN